MVCTKILIKEHLKEYILGKFNETQDGPVRFPDRYELYHLIYDLTETRPAGAIDAGNLEIILPERHNGKKTATFNYLGIRSQRLIEDKIETMMWAEVHDQLDSEKHRRGLQYNDTVYKFMKRYNIISLSEDAFLKNFYRFREKVRKKTLRRNYRLSKSVKNN